MSTDESNQFRDLGILWASGSLTLRTSECTEMQGQSAAVVVVLVVDDTAKIVPHLGEGQSNSSPAAADQLQTWAGTHAKVFIATTFVESAASWPIGLVMRVVLHLPPPISKGRDEEAEVVFVLTRGDLIGPELDIQSKNNKRQILFEKDTEVKTFSVAWSKYKKRVIIVVAVQTMTSLTGVNTTHLVQHYYQTALCATWHCRTTDPPDGCDLRHYRNLYQHDTIPSASGQSRSGQGYWLRFGRPIDLIYSALMSHFFVSSNNKIGKGFAILDDLDLRCGDSADFPALGLASLSHFVWNIALTETGPNAFVNIKENYYYKFRVVESADRDYLLTVVYTFRGYDILLCDLRVPVLPGGQKPEQIAADFGDDVASNPKLVMDANDSDDKLNDERRERVSQV
ncbi:hypothetical protein C8J56DRAFT_1158423 [Mycena floridula]|nr:hypothetical protein C8J56DRAFT_1158423 [Mycena floridula]